MFMANCNAIKDLPIPPTELKTPGVDKGIRRSTRNCTSGGLPTNCRISYRLIPSLPPTISDLTAPKPLLKCRSLKSPLTDGNLITVSPKLFAHSLAFFSPTPFSSLSNANVNFACECFLNLVNASIPKLALNTTKTGRLVAMCTLIPVATPSTTTHSPTSLACLMSNPIGNTFPLISDDDTKRLFDFLSMCCNERISPSIE